MTALPVALTAQEDFFLLVSCGPVVLAAVVIWLLWRWAKRSEAAERDSQPPDP